MIFKTANVAMVACLRGWEEVKERIISALIGVPVLLCFVIIGGLPLALLVAGLMMLGFYEFGEMVKAKGHQFLFWPVAIGGMAMLIAMVCQWPNWASMGMMVAFALIFLLTIINYPKVDVASVGVNFLALVYIGWTLPHLVAIDTFADGTLILLYLFFGIWSSDSGAYFVGKFLGKHKLAPRISPNKTVEGALGGVLATLVVLSVLNHFLLLFTLNQVLIFAFFLSLLGQFGDLVESLLKRFLGVKDSGHLIPGHGGILDRFDSIIMAAPFIYYIVLLLGVWGYNVA